MYTSSREEVIAGVSRLVSRKKWISSLNQLKEIQAQIISQSLHHHNDNYWVSLLIHQCTHLRAPLSHTLPLFNSVPHPNVRLFTSMLKFYSQLDGCHDDAFLLFSRMRSQSQFKMDSFVYRKHGDVALARRVFDEMSHRVVADWNFSQSFPLRLGSGVGSQKSLPHLYSKADEY